MKAMYTNGLWPNHSAKWDWATMLIKYELPPCPANVVLDLHTLEESQVPLLSDTSGVILSLFLIGGCGSFYWLLCYRRKTQMQIVEAPRALEEEWFNTLPTKKVSIHDLLYTWLFCPSFFFLAKGSLYHWVKNYLAWGSCLMSNIL